jgi:predicted nucleic acid-binding protein
VSFLLDTNVVSEAGKRRPNAQVIGWLESVPASDLFLSVVTLGEFRKGIELKRRSSEQAAARLDEWLQSLALHYRSRTLVFDDAVADRWGRLMANYPSLSAEDGQLAATALHHGLTFVTRNVRDIAPTGVPHFNPF